MGHRAAQGDHIRRLRLAKESEGRASGIARRFTLC
jgi:hypothetical protein